jgi:MOSC domain-containing protein YiiM
LQTILADVTGDGAAWRSAAIERSRQRIDSASVLTGSAMTLPHLVSIHVGKIAPLGPDGTPSAFIKHSVDRSVQITNLGIEGDEQADLAVHGGLDKAVYGYSSDNYSAWQIQYPQHSSVLVPGGFGENLCIEGMREADLCIGDVHRIRSVRLQVCQPRQPCFKLALRFADKTVPRAMVRSGRAGWYYRVIEGGEIGPHDDVHLDERPNPDFSFARFVEVISHGRATRRELERMLVMKGLASQWRNWANARLSQRD